MLNQHRRERGQDLVEYALVLPVLLLLLLGIIELSLILFSSNTIDDAAREGARLGVIGTNAYTPAGKAEIQNAAREVIDAARLNCANLTVTPSQTGSTVRVEVACQMNLIAWITGSPSITLRAVSTKQIELE